jgi:hypothetical protein
VLEFLKHVADGRGEITQVGFMSVTSARRIQPLQRIRYDRALVRQLSGQ